MLPAEELMKTLITRWTATSLVLRIFSGALLGIIFALLLPQAIGISMLGAFFVGALKSVAPLLVLILVLDSLLNTPHGIGAKLRLIVFMYIISMVLAAAFAAAVSFLFPVELPLSTSALALPASSDNLSPHLFSQLLSGITENPLAAVANANYISILFWSIIFGLALKNFASPTTKQFLKDLTHGISKVVSWLIEFAPFGILGLVFEAVSTNGLIVFEQYGRLVATIVGCMLAVALFIIPLMVALLLRRNPYPLVFRCLKESGITAFFTRSSAANIPVNMDLCQRLQLDENIYAVSIPLGATLNMNASAVTLTILALAAAHSLGLEVGFGTAFVLCLFSTISACGASGVAGGSLLLIPLTCSLLGIPENISAQVVAIGFITSIIQDSFETTVNSASDVIFTATADYYYQQR